MGGGLIQMVAYGSQDMYLTGNPQITFFKSVYRRHTNFAIESIKNTVLGTKNFGGQCYSIMSRSGDLIHKMYLQVKLPSINLSTGLGSGQFRAFRWLNWIGHVLIDSVEFSIGGQRIDRHTGEWLHLWNELSQSLENSSTYAEMVGNIPKLTQIQSSNNSSTDVLTEEYKLYIPLQFWFCRHPGLALPIIALNNSEIKVDIEFRNLDECIWASLQDNNQASKYGFSNSKNALPNSSSISLSEVEIYTDYILLDTAERRRFSSVQHEYLIEQVQHNNTGFSITSNDSEYIFNLNHPVKEMIWVVQQDNFTESGFTQSRAGRQYFNYTDAWDYSGFTGTPENYYGPGLGGGRGNQNIFYGLPTVDVEGAVNTTNATWASNDTATANASEAGYNNIEFYTVSGGVNKYNDRTLEHLLGPSNVVPNSGNKVGIWTNTSNSMNFNDGGKNPVTHATIKLNGNERFSEREGFYFNVIQPYQHHTGSPAPGINVYSFALKPEDYQPSGTCNFSRIDSSIIHLKVTNATINTSKLKIYAVNYNILRIMGGNGGLAYSN